MKLAKPTGYDESPVFTGESNALPAGKYICVIKSAKEVTTQNGARQLVILFDIADGEYKGFYNAQYQAASEKDGTKAKWKGIYRQGIEGKSIPFFKGLITSIEESNTGYTWNWDTDTLKNKKIGIVCGREQFKADDGTLKWATKAIKARSIQRLDKEEIPEDKLLRPNNSYVSEFADFSNVSEEDLPF